VIDWNFVISSRISRPGGTPVLPEPTRHQPHQERDMSKIFAAVLLATSIYAGPVSARGGDPAESMPGTNFTDMPSYQPKPVAPHVWIKHTRKHVGWRQGYRRGN
jgi:hypothetical protein